MRFYKAQEVAALLGISKQTLVRYEKKGVFPQSRRNRINKWREFTEEDVRKMRSILGRGFSLIELVMVIVIVAVLAVLALPRFDSFKAAKLNAAVKKVAGDIRYVQQLAISEHTAYGINFSVAADSYEVRRVNDSHFAIDPFSRQNFIVSFAGDPNFKGIDISSVSFNGTSGVRFTWEGIPQSVNNVDLSSEGSVRLVSGSNNRTVYVRPGTGTVRVQ